MFAWRLRREAQTRRCDRGGPRYEDIRPAEELSAGAPGIRQRGVVQEVATTVENGDENIVRKDKPQNKKTYLSVLPFGWNHSKTILTCLRGAHTSNLRCSLVDIDYPG